MVPGQPDAQPILDVVVRHTQERVIHPGKPTQVNDPSKNSYTWWLRNTARDGWKLVRWDVVEVGI
jgi:hypothetical protein